MATLFVVGTPIGNLGDCSPRAVQTLADCALIAAEDTRVTRKLLAHFDIHTPLISYHAHNEPARAAQLVQRMCAEGIDVALVSDAGMPTLSDPGAVLVRKALLAGLEVVSVPGPSAVTAALSLTGWEIPSYGFFGFLPRTNGPLQKRLLEIAQSGVAMAVVYESPFRIVRLTQAIAAALPGVPLCVCCDLTKRFELTVRGSAEEVVKQLQANPSAEKGEYCVVMDVQNVVMPAKAEAPAEPGLPLEARIVALMAGGSSLEEAVQALRDAGERRNDLYKAQLALKKMLAFHEEEEKA